MITVITNDRHEPVAVASSIDRARDFVYRQVHVDPDDGACWWTRSGKLMAGKRWTGWEVKGVGVC